MRTPRIHCTLCANMNETPTPKEFRVEGEEGVGDECLRWRGNRSDFQRGRGDGESNPAAVRMVPACTAPALDGMIVTTASERVQEARRFVIELFLARTPHSPRLRALGEQLGVKPDGSGRDVVGEYLLNRAPKRPQTDCILCGLCVRACAEIPMRHAISFAARGMDRSVDTPFHKVAESCIGCGACAHVCPTDAITIEAAS